MRTTVTLDDDVAMALERLRRARGTKFKPLLNELLRAGLRQAQARPARRRRFRTRSVALGRSRIRSLDSVADALAVAEGEAFG